MKELTEQREMTEVEKFKFEYDNLLVIYNEGQEKPKDKLPADLVGEFLLENLGWALYEDDFYFYNFLNGNWETLGNNINDTNVFTMLYVASKKYNTDGVLRAIMRQLKNGLNVMSNCGELEEQSKQTLTTFKNGVYDYKEQVFKPKSKDVFALEGYRFDYEPQEEVPELYAKWLYGFLNSDEGLYNYWLDELANLTQSHRPRGRIQLIKGKSGVGKSLFTDLISKVALKTASINSKAVNDSFALENVGDSGTLLISPDLSDDLYFNDNERLKVIATGDNLEIQRKGKKNYSKPVDWITVFACNTLPKFKNRDEQMVRRFATTVVEHESLNAVLKADWYADMEELLSSDNIHKLVCYLVTREHKQFTVNNEDIPNSIFLGNKKLWEDRDPLIENIVIELQELDTIHLKTINDIAKDVVISYKLKRGYRLIAKEIIKGLENTGYKFMKNKVTEPYSITVDSESYTRNGGRYDSYVKK